MAPHRTEGAPADVDVFISIDMEGVAGVTTLRQTYRGTDDYVWARELMTEEANAAIAGAFDAGIDRIVVSDSHGDMGNLLPHKLDQRAELAQGTPKVPYSMMSGIETGFLCALFLGYHAGAGTQGAILDHTYTGFVIDVRVNGESWNETHLNAALAGTFGVPVALVVGDRACCEQAAAKLEGVRTLSVKEGYGSTSGRSQSPELARTLIRAASQEAIRQAGDLRPFQPRPAVHPRGRRAEHADRRRGLPAAADRTTGAEDPPPGDRRRARDVSGAAVVDDPGEHRGARLPDRVAPWRSSTSSRISAARSNT